MNSSSLTIVGIGADHDILDLNDAAGIDLLHNLPEESRQSRRRDQNRADHVHSRLLHKPLASAS